MATNEIEIGMNHTEDSSAKQPSNGGGGGAGDGDKEVVPGAGTAAADPQQQSNEEISGYSDTQLKALLDEAMTYKTPKDLAHKSETFKELLKRAETEEESLESSFDYNPFTSSGGGSLQNIFESVNSESRKYSSAGSANPRRHHISGHSYGRHSQSHYYHRGTGASSYSSSGAGGGHGSGGGGVGSGGSGSHHQHSGHHSGRGHGSDRSFVSSRQGEGGSLPSNVNTRSAEVHPFIAEMAAVPGRRAMRNGINNNNNNLTHNNGSDSARGGGGGGDVYETMVVGEPLSKAAARSVAARGTSVGFDTEIPYAQLASEKPRKDSLSVIINMGDSGAEDQSEEQHNGVWSAVKKVTSHEVIAEIGRPLMDLEVDVVGSVSAETAAVGSGAGRRIDLTKYRNITSLPTNRLIPRASILILQQQQSNSASQREQLQHYRTNLKIDIEQGAAENESLSTKGTAASWPEYDPNRVVAQMDVSGSAFVGQTSAPVPAHSVYEHVDKTIKLSLEPKCLDPLSNAYVSVKNGRGDQKSEMIIVTPSQVAPSHDRELQKRKIKHTRHERNTTTIQSDEIVGFRGEETDLDRLVQFIESKENEQHGKTQQDKRNKNKGVNKKEQQNGGGKLKKSNSMNELRSCSKLDEITSEKSMDQGSGGVLLRSKAAKNNKGQNDNNGKSQDVRGAAASTPTTITSSKRGDRRSWGTEELQYLGDTDAAGGESSFLVDTNNNMSSSNSTTKKKSSSCAIDKRPDKTAPPTAAAATPAEMSIHTKTLGELPVNSVSMESLVSSSWANEEFRVVTKKRKSKKKQSIVVQSFEVDRRTFNSHGGGNKVGRTDQLFGGLGNGSQRNAKNRPNNLIASITNTNSSSTSNGAANRTAGPGNGQRSSASGGGGGGGASGTNSHGRPAKSRRKSTSSVPSSNHSDCSDLDSVHSLPIESPSSAKVKAKSASSGTGSKSKAGATGNGPQGVSYADIAKTTNSQKPPPPPQTTASNTSEAVNGLVAEERDRDAKWPLISSASGREEATGVENGEKVTKWVNGGVVGAAVIGEALALGRTAAADDRLQQTMSDILKNSHADVVRSAEVINVAIGQNQPAGGGAGVGEGNKVLLQKSKSVDNESTGFNMNIDQYPSLEKTVNKKATVPLPVVNINTNNKESPQLSLVPGKKLKLLSSIVSDTVNSSSNNKVSSGLNNSNAPIPNTNTVQTLNASAKATSNPEQVGNDLPTTDSASRLNDGQRTVENGEMSFTGAVNTNNNNNHSTTEVKAAPPKEQQQVPKGQGNKSNKSNRNRTSSMPHIATSSAGTASETSSTSQRPAVIILNDNTLCEGSDITFGFDVNNQLLFGDFEEDEIRFLEPYGAGADVLLANDDSGSTKNLDQINTSDYNSYDSSLCSSSSATGGGGGGTAKDSLATDGPALVGRASTEGLVFDGNTNNRSNDTAEELEVPPVSRQPQSTPKQQPQQINVINCTNCTRANASSGEPLAGEGMALMKNSCVQTSLDNLVMAPELNSDIGSNAVVVTVADLESRNSAVILKKSKQQKASFTPDWADAEVEGNAEGSATTTTAGDAKNAGDGEGFDSIKAKLQQFALINAQFARQAPMGWMCNQMNSFFNNHENVINFVGLAWEDLTHNKGNTLKYYNGQ